jgi:hypothetical protein
MSNPRDFAPTPLGERWIVRSASTGIEIGRPYTSVFNTRREAEEANFQNNHTKPG